MSKFEPEIWQHIGPRLRELRGVRSTEPFLLEYRLSPRIPWNMVERGHRGLDIVTVLNICEKLDVSPAWLLLGKGPQKLSQLPDGEESQYAKELVEKLQSRKRSSIDKQIAYIDQFIKKIPEDKQRRVLELAENDSNLQSGIVSQALAASQKTRRRGPRQAEAEHERLSKKSGTRTR